MHVYYKMLLLIMALSALPYSFIHFSFGSKVVGSRTGIIFNNEMDDFSTPGVTNLWGFKPSPSNFIGK